MTKNNFECVIFDLDGTLISSHDTIYYTTLKTFETLGLEVEIPKGKFLDLIGHHFVDIFEQFGINNYDFEEFIEIYKKLYFDFIHLSKPYPHVREILTELKNKGIKTGLLTTKAQGQAEKILKHFDLTKFFDAIMGRRDGINHKPDPEPLLLTLEEMGCENASKALMVGDSELDVRCGKNASVKTAAVSYGYRNTEFLLNENPDYLINDLTQLLPIVTNNKG